MPTTRPTHLHAVETEQREPSAVRVAEFFAGIGLARIGLERSGAEVVWANDFDADKAALYAGQFGSDHMVEGSIEDVNGDSLPDVDLAWSSFPCTDLSVAGNRKGLAGAASGTFWQFTRVISEMGERKPAVIALENVVGFATSHGGDDLSAAIQALNELGYSADVLALDARRFVPQSRPRMFIVAALEPPADAPEPHSDLRPDWLQAAYGDPSLRTHRAALAAPPAPLTTGLSGLIERQAEWWDEVRTEAFLSSLSEIQAERLEVLRRGRTVSYRTAYRRTRQGVARWEVRADDISGCLRTARGGSSKQAVVRAGRGSVRVRWMTPREYARLMGAPDYRLEGARTLQALFGFGDAVAVPAVAWLAENYLVPLAQGRLHTAELKAVSGV